MKDGTTAIKATRYQNWQSDEAFEKDLSRWCRWLWNGQWLAGLTSVVKFGKRMISADWCKILKMEYVLIWEFELYNIYAWLTSERVSLDTRQNVMCLPSSIDCSIRRVNRGSAQGNWYRWARNERSWNSTGSEIINLSERDFCKNKCIQTCFLWLKFTRRNTLL